MASVFLKRNRWYARLKGDKLPGKWSNAVAEGCVTREEAMRYATAAQKAIDKRRGVRAPGAISLRDWVDRWLVLRQEASHDWRKDRGRLVKHALPAFGSSDLTEITTAQIAELVHALRFRAGLANRTVRNVYSVLCSVFRDARIAGHLQQTPCVLTDAQLGPVMDKDPKWRASALFTRAEAEAMISDPRIPLDRRVVYGFGLLAGLRPGEAAALRWQSYDVTAAPLGRLEVAVAYSTNRSIEKSTKTNAVKSVPVHPALAALLAEWRGGWESMMGHAPEPSDLIVPLPPDVKRTKREGDRFRGWDYTGRRWREIDLPLLGWRHRSVYDTRATFITLALEDGADREILRERVTHAKPRRDAFDGYDRGERWAETCREVARLKLAPTCAAKDEIMSKNKKKGQLRRRVSNGQSCPPQLRVIQGGREVERPAATTAGQCGEQGCYRAARCVD